MKNSIKATRGPSLQLMTTRPMVRLNFIRIFSKVGNLGQGVYIELGKSGGLSLRDEVDISNRKYYTTSPPSKVASRGFGYISSKKKRQHSFEVASIIIIIVSLIQLFLQFLILFNYLVNLIFTPT